MSKSIDFYFKIAYTSNEDWDTERVCVSILRHPILKWDKCETLAVSIIPFFYLDFILRITDLSILLVIFISGWCFPICLIVAFRTLGTA